jgi:hypothetical protein
MPDKHVASRLSVHVKRASLEAAMDSTILAGLIGGVAAVVAALIAKWPMRDDSTRPTDQRPGQAPPRRGKDSNPAECTDAPVASRPQLTVHGEVIRAIGQDLGLRVHDAEEIRAFWRAHQIDTKLDWFDSGTPVVSLGRKKDIESCKPGDWASLTFVVEDRANGKRGTRTIDFKIQPERP